MNVGYLIDSIVQQTTVLIAQVATTAGVRAPLAHVANRVFLDLVTEIERQGVARKVVADMFGLALRSYQQKVQRLSESATDSGRTLWEASCSPCSSSDRPKGGPARRLLTSSAPPGTARPPYRPP